jgi:transposase-like protein
MSDRLVASIDCPRCEMAEMEYLPRMHQYTSADWYRCEHCGYLVTVESPTATTSQPHKSLLTTATIGAAACAAVAVLVRRLRTPLPS